METFSQNILLVDFGNDSISMDFDQSFHELGVDYQSLDILPDSLNDYNAVFIILHYGEDRQILSSAEESVLVDYLENHQGRLYLEGGDHWYNNRRSKLTSLFKINAINHNNSDAYVNGIKGTMAEGFEFRPDTYNHYIDDIQAIEPAKDIFTSFYGTNHSAVAYCADFYKTIGVSFELAQLNRENNGHTKTDLIANMLKYFSEPACGTFSTVLNVFPNPTTDFFYITSNVYVKSASIFNTNGQLVKEVNSPTVVDMQYLNRGIYFVRIEAGDEVITKRIIKQ